MINTRLLYLCTQQLYLLLLQLQLLPDMGESSKNSLMECSRSRPIIKYDDTGSWANVDDFLPFPLDPALTRSKSYRKGAASIRRIGD
ncbi:hypothetical protein Tco_0060984 [Tanacetum coccineum]